jgi:hypothetical protein
MTEAAIFTCSICGEQSGEICVFCTKDACRNHRCDRCKRCSDCCECDVPLSASETPAATEMEQPAQPEAPAPEAEAASENEPSEDIPPPQNLLF